MKEQNVSQLLSLLSPTQSQINMKNTKHQTVKTQSTGKIHIVTEHGSCRFWEISRTQGLNALICFLFLVITLINERSWTREREKGRVEKSVPTICMSVPAKELIRLFITSLPDTANCTLIYSMPLCQANSKIIYTLSKNFTPHFITFLCSVRLCNSPHKALLY